MSILRAFVIGKPVPQGSKRFLGMQKTADGRWRGRMREASEALVSWRADIRREMIDPETGAPRAVFNGAVTAKIVFWMPRPKSLPKKAVQHVKRPDLDKLVRAVFDALGSAGVVPDDSQITWLKAAKFYQQSDKPTGCEIELMGETDADTR